MKQRIMIGILSAAALAAHAQPAGPRPNQPVFHAGAWTVVRSVRDGGDVVGCTGFYRAHRGVQLSKDALILKSPVALNSVGLLLDGAPLRRPGPPSKTEDSLGAVVLTGAEFEALAKASTLTLELVTAQGPQRVVVTLRGFAAALENIHAGCPVPDRPLRPAARP